MRTASSHSFRFKKNSKIPTLEKKYLCNTANNNNYKESVYKVFQV